MLRSFKFLTDMMSDRFLWLQHIKKQRLCFQLSIWEILLKILLLTTTVLNSLRLNENFDIQDVL